MYEIASAANLYPFWLHDPVSLTRLSCTKKIFPGKKRITTVPENLFTAGFRLLRLFHSYAICIAVLFFLALPLHASTSSAVTENSNKHDTSHTYIVDTIHIQIHGSPDHEKKWQTMARNLIVCRKGTVCSDKTVDQSRAVLLQSGKFKDVSVTVTRTGSRTRVLTFSLTPVRIIRTIRIVGEYPFFESEIHNIMTIRRGSSFSRKTILMQQEIIRSFLTEKGFIHPQVTIDVDTAQDHEYCTVLVDIELDKYIRVRNIAVTGNTLLSEFRIKRNMRIWRNRFIPGQGGRFIEKELIKDVKKIQRFYWNRGFAECRITLSTDVDTASQSVNITLDINEGPRYKIKLSHADTVARKRVRWKRSIRKEIVLDKEGNINNFGIRKSIERIKRFYRTKGYHRPAVTARDSLVEYNGDSTHYIIFTLDPGYRTTVEAMSIEGNEYFTKDKINRQILTGSGRLLEKKYFDAETLEKDILAIKALYLQHGFAYIDISKKIIENLQTHTVSVVLTINEGKQIFIDSVSFSGLTVLDRAHACSVITCSKGSPFDRYVIENDVSVLSRHIAEKGYPYVKIASVIAMDPDSNTAHVEFTVEENNYVTIGPVYYQGNFKTKRSLLNTEMIVQQGEPFSLLKVMEGQKNVRNLDIFRSVTYRIIGLQEKLTQLPLFIELEERKPYYLNASIGYESDALFYTEARLGNRNFLGLNKDIVLGGKLSKVMKRTTFSFTEPRLLGTKTSAAIELYFEKETKEGFSVQTYGTTFGINRKITKQITVNSNLLYQRRTQLHGAQNPLYPPRHIVMFSPSAVIDKRDSFVRPRHGFYSALHIDFSKGIDRSFDDFIRYRTDLKYYYTPFERITAALRGQLWHLDPYGKTKTVPLDQLFDLGGSADVRGFRDNFLFFTLNNGTMIEKVGYSAIAANMETRIDLGANFELALFFDLGALRNKFIKQSLDDIHYSAGAGLRYLTPVGPLGVLYGFKLRGEPYDTHIGQFHFSFGYTF